MQRKILALGVFSLCCVGLFAGPAKAWLFSPWCCHNRYTTQITCRPYNAFTPICWGNMVCDGCCPSGCGGAAACPPMPMPSCGPPPCCGYGPGMGIPYMGGPGMGGSCGGDGCCASDMPMPMQQMPMQMPMQQMPMQMPMQQMPMQPMPMQQPYAPPMPMPNVTMGYPPMQQGIAQANYYTNNYPAPYPAYYPNYAMPMPMPMNYNPYPAYPAYPASPAAPVPYYWYGAGR